MTTLLFESNCLPVISPKKLPFIALKRRIDSNESDYNRPYWCFISNLNIPADREIKEEETMMLLVRLEQRTRNKV